MSKRAYSDEKSYASLLKRFAQKSRKRSRAAIKNEQSAAATDDVPVETVIVASESQDAHDNPGASVSTEVSDPESENSDHETKNHDSDSEHEEPDSLESVTSPSSAESTFLRHLDHVLDASELSHERKKFLKHSCEDLDKVGDGGVFKLLSDQDSVASIHSTHLNDHLAPRLFQQWSATHRQKKKRRKLNDGSTTATSEETTETDRCELTNHLQRAVFPAFNSYRDTWVSIRTHENAKFLTEAAMLHAANHTLKSRDLILKNNSKLAAESKSSDEVEYRDQGFTRPKVLILAPLRNSAYRLIQAFLKLLPRSQKAQVQNEKRFHDEYGPEPDDKVPENKPADYKAQFEGSIDDNFQMGISLTGKSVKLFSEFFKSDVIVASPLALKMVLDNAEENPERSADFLSSIEVLIINECDVILMQNFGHLEQVVDSLNCQPKATHDTDFFRVRQWFLDDKARFYRQTIVLSGLIHPSISSLFARQSNFEGKVKIKRSHTGTISRVLSNVKQIFRRFECDKFSSLYDRRFEVFKKDVLPQIRSSANSSGHTLIYVPEYFDFVILRNYLNKEEVLFASISEYSDQSQIARSMKVFEDGTARYLLVTERFYFFRRQKVRGVHDVVFYSLPMYPHFYSDILNMVDQGDYSSLAMFSKFDGVELERIVGTSRARTLLSASKDTHLFA